MIHICLDLQLDGNLGIYTQCGPWLDQPQRLERRLLVSPTQPFRNIVCWMTRLRSRTLE